MISVAIATYNGEKYIEKQLFSILLQTVPVDEVVICDDGSADKTVKVVDDFIERNGLKGWMLYVNEKNLGFSSNFFKAVSLTQGDIVFLADQDDLWDSDKVALMSSAMQSEGAYMITSLSSTIDKNGNPANITLRKRPRGNKKGELVHYDYSDCIGGSVAPGCSMCIRSEVRDFLVANEELKLNQSLGHDWYLSIVASTMGPIIQINKTLFKRRVHDSNASLGKLRKKTALASSNEFRISCFKQVIAAHQFLLDNHIIKEQISEKDKWATKGMIIFFKDRMRFHTSKNPFLWLMLAFCGKKYFQCAKSVKTAIRLWIADLLYTYQINFRIKR